VIHLRQVAEDNARVSSQMAAKNNRCYQDLHVAADNAIRMLSPLALVRMTLANCLYTVPLRVMEVATYCIRLRAASAMAAA